MIWFQIVIPIIFGTLLIQAIDLAAEKVITLFKEKREKERIEEAKRYAAFFSRSGEIQR